jgi:hypothetical protein
MSIDLWSKFRYAGVPVSVLVPLPFRDSLSVLTHNPNFKSTDERVDLGIGSTNSWTPVYFDQFLVRFNIVVNQIFNLITDSLSLLSLWVPRTLDVHQMGQVIFFCNFLQTDLFLTYVQVWF